MTEPTGYTALDLVGFTDKGTYNTATAYVKNDLVHYSGDIWRCLIDDTTNITPVEGTNWTVFIEAPANAIEGIIAPVETNPATNSYAVGRQFIYNDALYEVIVAITAGDALVAYEDDPDNANIQLADPVETQLLNFEEKAYAKDDITETDLASDDLVPFYDTSAAAKRQMTVANMIGQTVSNPNLLDNPWFTVNQRGATSYGSLDSTDDTHEYTVDRWTYRKAYVEVTSNGLKVKTNASTDHWNANILQGLDNYSNLLGRTVTLSVDFAEINIDTTEFDTDSNYGIRIGLVSGDNAFAVTQPIDQKIINSPGIHTLTVALPNSINYNLLNVLVGMYHLKSGRTTSNSYYVIRSVKLEMGDISTLSMDTSPNYAAELLKCQRYFINMNSTNTPYSSIGVAINESNDSRVYISTPLPVTMRATPSVTLTGDLKLSGSGINVNITDYSAYISRFEGNTARIGVASNSSLSLTAQSIFLVYGTGVPVTYTLSADL